ncbi:MAG: RsmD family RNA methyltransferase [Planctomycetota bacterium]
MLRILGGEFRSRQLASPPDESVTRPFASRAKESVFNMLRGWFDDAHVLDLFAGVGTMGLEAVSVGAASVLLVEQHPKTFALLEQNIASLECGGRAIAMRADALGPTCLARAPRPLDIVFADPPYPLMRKAESRASVLEQLARCRDLMKAESFLVLRSDVDPEEVSHRIEGFDGPEIHTYGRRGMRVLLYQPSASQTADIDSDETSPSEST